VTPQPAGPIRLQPLARARVESLGEVGAAWAATLPARLAETAAQWSLTLGRPRPGGSSSYVVSARTRDGRDVVLKMAMPAPGLDEQVEALRRADGRGYVRLLGYDGARRALLLEALGGSLQQSGRPVADQLRLLADTLALAWRPATDHPQAATDKAAGLRELVARLWRELDRPCPERVIDQALSYADRRSADPGELVVVHGDPHPGNLLAVPETRPGAETGWCFVDPDGFVADRAYDLGVVLREWTGQLDEAAEVDGAGARRRLAGYAALLADHTGVDVDRIWEWGYLERVSTGLSVLAFGAPRAAGPFLRTAALLLD
jgi:streptomycin 6-kinase